MMWRFLLVLIPAEALADSVVATRIIHAQTVLTNADMTLVAAEIPGALADTVLAVGQEARIMIYPGRPIKAEDLGPSVLVHRNQVVMLAYQSGPLAIVTEGRALDRGGAGDLISVMNLASRTKVIGQIGTDGVVRVGPAS